MHFQTLHRLISALPALFSAAALTMLLLASCSVSGVKTVDRAQGSPSSGQVLFRIHENAKFSLMNEPPAVFITKTGETQPLGYVGANFQMAPMGYVKELHLREPAGRHTYHYELRTAGKQPAIRANPVTGATESGVYYLKFKHRSGNLDLNVQPGKTIPVDFSLGPVREKSIGVGYRLDPDQLQVQQGAAY